MFKILNNKENRESLGKKIKIKVPLILELKKIVDFKDHLNWLDKIQSIKMFILEKRKISKLKFLVQDQIKQIIGRKNYFKNCIYNNTYYERKWLSEKYYC